MAESSTRQTQSDLNSQEPSFTESLEDHAVASDLGRSLSGLNVSGDPLYGRRLDPGIHEIRLLDFDHSEEAQTQSIRMTTSYQSLDDESYYHALSYTWGDPIVNSFDEDVETSSEDMDSVSSNSSTRPEDGDTSYRMPIIYVNNHEMEVTPNLYSALERLNKRYPLDKLWVDAICINQRDFTERTDQVRLMTHIYNNAEKVVVWLGEEAIGSDSALAIQAMEDMCDDFESFLESPDGEASKEFEQLGGQTEDLSSLAEALNWYQKFVGLQTKWMASSDFISRQAPEVWTSMAGLLSRSWFHRVWTYQEKTLAKSAVILVGDVKISWALFSGAINLIVAHDNASGRERLLPNGEYKFFLDSNMPQGSLISQIDQERGSHSGLFERVRDTRRRVCKEPRDRIYGVLSTISRNDPGCLHFMGMVDYERVTAQELFTEFTRFYIQDQTDLRILQSCTFPHKVKRLPSWVVDWHVIQIYNVLRYDQYRASGDKRSSIQHEKGSGRMIIRGALIDTVKLLAPRQGPVTMQELRNMGDDQEDWSGSKRLDYYLALYFNSIGDQSPQKLEGKWLELPRAIAWQRRYVTGENITEAYWRTLLGDLDPSKPFQPRLPADMSISEPLAQWARDSLPVEDVEPREQAVETAFQTSSLQFLQPLRRGDSSSRKGDT